MSESPEFDLIAWMRQEMDRMYAEEVTKKLRKIFELPIDDMSQAMGRAQEGFIQITKAFEGVTSNIQILDDIWGYPKKFTPTQFNKMWDGFTKEQKIEYVRILIW
jgi:hypothetical protein